MLSELHTERSMAGVEAAANRYRQWFQRDTVQRFRNMIDPGPLMDDIVEITMQVDHSDSEQSSDHDEHEEDLVDALQVWPSRISALFLGDSSLLRIEVELLDVGQWSEDVLLDHIHDLIEVGYDQLRETLLILNHRLNLLDRSDSFRLRLHILGGISVIEYNLA